MENDLSNIQIRWHTLREEKVQVANTLRDVKKTEEELERLAEERSQLDFDDKVMYSSFFSFLFVSKKHKIIIPLQKLNMIDCGIPQTFSTSFSFKWGLSSLITRRVNFTLWGLP